MNPLIFTLLAKTTVGSYSIATQGAEMRNTYVTGTTSAVTSAAMIVAGIGAMFVLLKHSISIMQGEKFTIKMLRPIILAILVANFNWVMTPLDTITSYICGAIDRGSSASRLTEVRNLPQDTKDNVYHAAKYVLERGKAAAEAAKSDMFKVMLDDKTAENTPSAKKIRVTNKAKFDEKLPGYRKQARDKFFNEIGDDVHFDQCMKILKDAGIEIDIEKLQAGTGSFSELGIKYLGEKEDSETNVSDETLEGKVADLQRYIKEGPNEKVVRITRTVINTIGALAKKALPTISAIMESLVRTWAQISLTILAVFGPIVFAVSIYPSFEKTMSTWIARYIQISLWGPVCSVIASCANSLGNSPTNFALGMDGVVYIAAIFLYFSVPSMAAWVIESSGAGGTIGSVGGAASHAASAAGGAIGGAIKAPLNAKIQGNAVRTGKLLHSH